METMQSVLQNIGQWCDSHTLLITIISSIIGIIGIVVTVISIRSSKKVSPSTRKWRDSYILDHIPTDFEDYLPSASIYIQPYFTFKNKGLNVINIPRELRSYFLKKVFVKHTGADKVYCLLGDTGTGKTAALVHLFVDYINSRKKEDLPYEIRIFSLRNEKVFDNINTIKKEERGRYILLLDAMDENPMAADPKQYDDFRKQLSTICQEFKIVVFSCRPQFFMDEKAETIRFERGGKSVSATRIQLSPFRNKQVRAYLRKVFAPTETKQRKEAKQLVKKHAFIAIRPLVLSFIRDIVKNGHKIHNTLDLYDSIVESWFVREIDKSHEDDSADEDGLEETIILWWYVTSQVASYIYKNKVGQELSLTVDELKEAIGRDEWTELLNSMGIKTENEQPDSKDLELFRSRSLLTRIDNKYLFTHKSFYEYFMAYRFFLDYEEVDDMRGMDFAMQLVDDLYDAYQNHRAVRFANIGGIELNDVAGTYHQLGYFLYEINHFKEAEKEFQEALKIRRGLAATNPDAYQPYLAMTLNNLATLHSDTNQLELAEEEYQEALKIRRGLAAKNPDAYLPYVALTLNNLAGLHYRNNQLEPAEKEFQEALKIYRDLAAKSPDAYQPYVAGTLNNLAILHKNTNRLELAEKEYQEALKIYRDLAAKNPDAYLPYVAHTLNNLAILHDDTNKLELAEEEYQEALKIRRGLAAKNPDAYLPKVAQTLYNMALLYIDTDDLETADTMAQESLEKYKIMAELSHAAFGPYVKRGEQLLDIIKELRKNKS